MYVCRESIIEISIIRGFDVTIYVCFATDGEVPIYFWEINANTKKYK